MVHVSVLKWLPLLQRTSPEPATHPGPTDFDYLQKITLLHSGKGFPWTIDASKTTRIPRDKSNTVNTVHESRQMVSIICTISSTWWLGQATLQGFSLFSPFSFSCIVECCNFICAIFIANKENTTSLRLLCGVVSVPGMGVTLRCRDCSVVRFRLTQNCRLSVLKSSTPGSLHGMCCICNSTRSPGQTS